MGLSDNAQAVLTLVVGALYSGALYFAANSNGTDAVLAGAIATGALTVKEALGSQASKPAGA